MGAITDWIARNKALIGVVATALWGAMSADTAFVQEHQRLMLYLGPVFGAIFGAGAFKSDKYHKDKQDDLK